MCIRDRGNPEAEIRSYIRRKLEMARDFPRESRLFANEILQGAPRILPMLEGEMKELVEDKVEVIKGWMRAGKIVRTDPFHLIFSIWATTQHYADFDVQGARGARPGPRQRGTLRGCGAVPGAAVRRRVEAEGLTAVQSAFAIIISRPPHSVMLTSVR